MKTTVKALQDYYVEKGGQLADVADITTIPDMIDAITALGGGGSSLPAVTSDDNGDVLTVVEGAWDKAEASENVEIFEGTASNVDSTITLSNNKTAADIATAYSNGKIVEILVRQTSDNEIIMHYQLGRKSGNDYKFFSLYYTGSDIYAYFATVTSGSTSITIAPTKVKLAIAT